MAEEIIVATIALSVCPEGYRQLEQGARYLQFEAFDVNFATPFDKATMSSLGY